MQIILENLINGKKRKL